MEHNAVRVLLSVLHAYCIMNAHLAMKGFISMKRKESANQAAHQVLWMENALNANRIAHYAVQTTKNAILVRLDFTFTMISATRIATKLTAMENITVGMK